mmetsp:Transcript_50653/g.74065  ORF Transcript_50653/g.74065 Transcript_50653/m.74065 type:complete len:319 (+) Transcript_50653:72-1028(+)
MGGCYSAKPIILDAEAERQRVRSLSVKGGGRNEAETSMDRSRGRSTTRKSLHTAQLGAAMIEAQAEAGPDNEEAIMEAFLARIKEQTQTAFVATLLFLVACIFLYPRFGTAGYIVSGVIFVAGAAVFAKVGWQNAKEQYDNKQIGVITPAEVSTGISIIAAVCFLLSIPAFWVGQTALVLLNFSGCLCIYLSSLLDTWIWVEEKRLMGIKDFSTFDKWMTFLESMPFHITNLANFLFTVDMVFVLPSYIHEYYVPCINLAMFASALYCLAALIGMFLVFRQDTIQEWREKFLQSSEEKKLTPIPEVDAQEAGSGYGSV